ncbi:MAG: sodium:proton antiporter [Gammaproteobacteria bacterium]|nr:sodium:proton antiporter [Gammaproteobacteria bacterium]
MLSIGAILFFLLLLLAGYVLEPPAERLHVPRGVMLVTLGFAASELVTREFMLDTGIRWDNFNFLISNIFLPALTFHAALRLDARRIWNDIVPIFLLALPLMLAAVFIIGALLYLGVGHPEGFPIVIALLTAAMLSAADPGAVIGLLRRLGAPERLQVLLESEALFNDATAVVIFMVALQMTLPDAPFEGFVGASVSFLTIVAGGIAVGIVFGGILLFVLRYSGHVHIGAVATLACVYGAFLVAQFQFHFSGVMAVLATGLALAEFRRRRGLSGDFVESLWEFAAHVTSGLIFLIAGVTITLSMFRDEWLAMLIGIVALLLARTFIVFGLLGPLARMTESQRVPLNYQAAIAWTGTPGTFAMALALSLPVELEAWYTVQSIVYGTVLFGLFVQSSSLPWLLRRLKLTHKTNQGQT